ncbi:MAG: DNA polymerase III subunit alpha [Bacteroidota bacterium]
MFLIYDTETTGFPAYFDAPYSDLQAYDSCRMVQLAWQLHDAKGDLIEVKNFIVKPDGFDIPYNSEQIHGISTERAIKQGVDVHQVLEEFNRALQKAQFNVGHNIGFDINVVGSEMHRYGVLSSIRDIGLVDTMKSTVDFCALPGGKGGKFKFPKLEELHHKLFNEGFDAAHNASADVEATARCFLELIRVDVLKNEVLDWNEIDRAEFKTNNPDVIQAIGLNIQPYTPLSEEALEEEGDVIDEYGKVSDVQQSTGEFFHIHNHTGFSVLQSTTNVKSLVAKAKELKMPAVAFSDHGNLYGAFQFVNACEQNEILGIVGIELNVCKDHSNKSVKDNGFPTVLLAKNFQGYKNLIKLASKAYVDGFYYVPRVDRKLIEEFKEDLMVISGGIFGEISSLILNVGEKQAQEACLWWSQTFGDDFYLELNRHGLPEEDRVNMILQKFAREMDVKMIAANNTYYIDKEDANAHDILLCVKDAENQSTPKKYTGKRGRDYRFGFPNEEFYFKSSDEMRALFADLPECIDNLSGLLEKFEPYTLRHDVLLPKFDIPEEFRDAQDDADDGNRGENNYLRHLTHEGAKKRYGEISEEIKNRLDFELSVIENTGYPGYFLIVQDFTSQARKMGVSVGPGRGSAAGSAVAYCIGITNVDPIKYDLLFERFLNPERVSLPDIDIDFDDRGRDKIIEWVVNKYGASNVAQIITFGTMAAKSSIRDTARVMELPLSDADRIAKLIPDFTSLKKLFSFDDKELKHRFQNEQYDKVQQFMKIANGKEESADTIAQARVIEGSVRNTGIHACGVIITPEDLTNLVPVATAKDSDMVCTQFDNSVVEDAGLLKMDFLGLKTLTIIDDAIALVKQNHNIEIIADDIPLDDIKTYELFQRGETVGIFQYESDGMRKHMKDLKPDKFDDLIAMNALYRPGPLAYIPSFIKRKHGQEEIKYDLEDCKEHLEATYGITVYQEQVMLLSQKLANFTKGEADVLRKAMGKKKKDVLDKMFPKFLDGCQSNGHPEDKVNKIWKDWEAFASYAFNKSHSTCYALLGYQTAYLKANYPAEFMASLLSNNLNQIKTVEKFMQESKKMGIPVLGPCVNESDYLFTVNKKGEIRFGMGAIKGVGSNAVESIVDERNKDGKYSDCFDLVSRIDLRAANKRSIENLIVGGAFDCFGLMRSKYIVPYDGERTFMEDMMKFGQALRANDERPPDLFGDSLEVEIRKPEVPEVENIWSTLEMLRKEKEVIGIYVSGHPLDDFKKQVEHFAQGDLSVMSDIERYVNTLFKLPGMVTKVNHRVTKKGKPFGSFEMEDYKSTHEFVLFGEDYLRMKHFFQIGNFLMINGRVQKHRFREGEVEFKITGIELLSEIMGASTKEVKISLRLSDLNQDFVGQLNDLVKANQGNCNLKFEVFDLEGKSISMPSKSKKIEASNDFLQALDAFENVKYSLN